MMKLTIIFFVVSTLMRIGEGASISVTKTQIVGESRTSLIANLTAEVLKLESNTALIWLEESFQIALKKSSIKRKQSSAESTIETQLTKLENQVGAAIKKAYASRKNISACIVTEETDRWTNVDTKNLTQCVSFTAVELKLAELVAIPAEAATIVPTCTLLHPFNNNNFANCLQSELVKQQTQLGTIKEEIKDDLKTVTENDKNCIEENLKTLEEQIKTISNNFTKCVKNAKK